jgi:hypothetical protein
LELEDENIVLDFYWGKRRFFALLMEVLRQAGITSILRKN